MSMKIELECDARDCFNTTEIDDNHDSAIEKEGWVIDPHEPYQHYCPQCWPQVEKELESMDEE
jgi:hypothetical protein